MVLPEAEIDAVDPLFRFTDFENGAMVYLQ